MERLQGHFNSYILDRKSDAKSLEVQSFLSEEEASPFLSLKEPNFLTLLSLQNFKESWELESYLLEEDHSQFHSPNQSKTNRFYQNLVLTSTMEEANQALSSQELSCNRANMIITSSSSSLRAPSSKRKHKISHLKPQETTREKRKRRKTKPTKNIEEIENQRRNHIAVERNRRLQMNEHINSLRSLLPPCYIQRGDQASIVEGAINYVKGLEQILQTLESQKRLQENANNNQETTNNLLSGISSNNLWTIYEDESFVPRIEVTVIQNHVNLKVQCLKKQGQLLKGIISLEKLRLTVLHLNIVTLSCSSVSYSFNLKIEDDCELESVGEIKKVAHHIFDI